MNILYKSPNLFLCLTNIKSFVCAHLKRKQKYKVWQDGNQAKELYSNKLIDEKIIYIHNNPIRGLIVENPEYYLFSSARNYAGMQGLIEVDVID